MNTNTSAAFWPSAVASHSLASTIAATQSALIAAVAGDIVAAVASGDFTSSTAVSGETSVDVQYVMALLNQGGYIATNDGTDINVSW